MNYGDHKGPPAIALARAEEAEEALRCRVSENLWQSGITPLMLLAQTSQKRAKFKIFKTQQTLFIYLK